MSQKELLDSIEKKNSLSDVQAYVQKVIELRGFDGQSVQSNMLLLLEETGELAKAVRKSSSGMSVDRSLLDRYETVEGELADVFIVLLSICNTLGISLYDAFIEKERINIERNWTVNKV